MKIFFIYKFYSCTWNVENRDNGRGLMSLLKLLGYFPAIRLNLLLLSHWNIHNFEKDVVGLRRLFLTTIDEQLVAWHIVARPKPCGLSSGSTHLASPRRTKWAGHFISQIPAIAIPEENKSILFLGEPERPKKKTKISNGTGWHVDWRQTWENGDKIDNAAGSQCIGPVCPWLGSWTLLVGGNETTVGFVQPKIWLSFSLLFHILGDFTVRPFFWPTIQLFP